MKTAAFLSGTTLVAVTALSAAYIAFDVLKAAPFADTNRIEMSMPSRNLLQVGSPVNLNGIRIGSVKSVEREDSAAKVVLNVDAGYGIPVDSDVRIEQLSAVGEPYINFVPTRLRAPYLPDNAIVATERIASPPEMVDVFKRISSLTNAINSNDVAGLLESLKVATGATPEALERITQAGNLFEQVIMSRLPQIRAMLADSQKYQADMAWLPSALDGGVAALTDTLQEGSAYLRAIDEVVRKAGTPNINRDTITPFVQKIGPDATRLLTSLGPLAGPLIPVITQATAQAPQVDMAAALAAATRSFTPDGTLRIALTSDGGPSR